VIITIDILQTSIFCCLSVKGMASVSTSPESLGPIKIDSEEDSIESLEPIKIEDSLAIININDNIEAVRIDHHSVENIKDGSSVLINVACILEHILTNPFIKTPEKITKFHAAAVAQITIREYLKRIMKYCGASNEVFIMALYHIVNIYDNQWVDVSEFTLHRLLLCAILICAKFHDDVHYNNSYYSEIGGIALKELNSLEVEFLRLTNFDQPIGEDYLLFYSQLANPLSHSKCKHSLLHAYSVPIDPEILKCEVACKQLSIQ
jgi:hypothetical protein